MMSVANQKISDLESGDSLYRQEVAVEHQRLKKLCSELTNNLEAIQGSNRTILAENERLTLDHEQLKTQIKESNFELSTSFNQIESFKKQINDIGYFKKMLKKGKR